MREPLSVRVESRVESSVIESHEGSTHLSPRSAPVDGELQFVTPDILSGVLKERWKQFSGGRTPAGIRRQ